MGKKVNFVLAVLDQILFIFAGNDNIHKSLAEFENWPDPTKERLKIHNCHFLYVAIYMIHFKFVGIGDMHNI